MSWQDTIVHRRHAFSWPTDNIDSIVATGAPTCALRLLAQYHQFSGLFAEECSCSWSRWLEDLRVWSQWVSDRLLRDCEDAGQRPTLLLLSRHLGLSCWRHIEKVASFVSIAASFCSGGRYQKVVPYYGSHEVSDCPSKVQRWSLPPGPCTLPQSSVFPSACGDPWISFKGPFLLLRQQFNPRNLKCILIFIQRTLWVSRGLTGLDNLLLFADCQL